MDPINYQSTVQPAFQAVAQGYQLGAGIRDDQFQQQQQQIALQQQQQLLAARQATLANPTASNYANLMTIDPQAAAAMKNAWDTRNTAQQTSFASDLGSWGSAIANGQPQLAADALNNQADLIEQQNGGQPTPESQSKRALAQLTVAHPQVALGKIIALADANPQGQQVATALRTQITQPATTAKAQADAVSATAKANVDAATVGDQVTAAGLKNAQTQQEINASQLAGRISELNVQIAQANSETQRGQLTLERDKLVQQQAQLHQSQGQAAQDSLDAATNALQTVQSIKQHPGLDGFFSGHGTWLGGMIGKIPGTDREALQGWVDSLRSQLAFDKLQQMKAAAPTGASGLGQLSEGELKALSEQAGNLDLNSKDFPTVLSNVERYLNKAQSTTLSRPYAPTAPGGGAYVMTSPKYGVITEGRVNQLMAQNPGSTRDQILRFLEQPAQIPTK